MSAIKLSAQKVKDMSNLKKIAEGWRECAINRSGIDQDQVCATGFVQGLAGYGKSDVSDMVLNDPDVCISPGDKYASKVQWASVCGFDSGNIYDYGEAIWSRVTNPMTNGDRSLFSCCLIANLSGNVPLSATPFGFTRWLKINGKWHSSYGLYGSKGGYVVFCDGHVTWFDGDKSARFLKCDQSGYTSDIREAVPDSAFISGGMDLRSNIADTDGSIMLLEHRGAWSLKG
jgi:prepilin-type processing-associated H-X9-DG protein